MLHLIPRQKSFILFSYPLWHSHSDKGGHSLSLSPMACTQWFQLIFPSFGSYVIPAGHFPQKCISGKRRISFPLLSIVRAYPLLSLTHGPPLLYWLGTSRWCLSLVRAPLPCVSMACLLFMHLPWLKGLSACSATRSWPLVAWMSVWAFILCLTSFLGWALLGYGPFLLQSIP